MTREQEIVQKAYEISQRYFPDSENIWERTNIEAMLTQSACCEIVKWADEHPNLYNDEKYHTVKVSCLDELNRKAKLYDDNWYNYCGYTTFNGDLMIEDLKREMEEEL